MDRCGKTEISYFWYDQSIGDSVFTVPRQGNPPALYRLLRFCLTRKTAPSQVLSCRWGQDKIWTRPQPISVLLSCQNATNNKPESRIYVFMPNFPPVQHTSWNCWPSLLLLGGSWSESSGWGSGNWCGLILPLGQVTPILVLSFPICKTVLLAFPYHIICSCGGLIDFEYPLTSTIMGLFIFSKCGLNLTQVQGVYQHRKPRVE